MKPLRTNVCQCGNMMSGKYIIPPLMIPGEVGIHDVNFYGGNVKKVANAKCSCGEEYILFLRPVNNGYDVIDMAKKDGVEFEEKVQKKEKVKRSRRNNADS